MKTFDDIIARRDRRANLDPLGRKLATFTAEKVADAHLMEFDAESSRMVYDILMSMDADHSRIDARYLPFDKVFAQFHFQGELLGVAAEVTSDGVEIRLSDELGFVVRSGAGLESTTTFDFPEVEEALLRTYSEQQLAEVAKGVAGRAMLAFAALCAFSVLRRSDDVLEASERPAYSRQQRRQAKRAGKPLPEHNTTHISLGEIGRRHNEAAGISTQGGKRRAHWVRGHLFLARNGELTWRNPHVRGYGKVKATTRKVHGGDIPVEAAHEGYKP